jgi:hypothetical protein
MPRLIDMIGYENEYLKVVGKAPEKVYDSGTKVFQWECICKNCGKHFSVTGRNIREKKVKSCGCLTFELKSKAHRKHGMFGSRLYLSWAHMISRCSNKNDSAYKNYGGRGIKVCDEWKESFENFEKWALEEGYNEKLTIDRIDVNGNYEPSNCRWATYTEQVRNRRSTVIVEIDGEKKPLAEWCEIYNMKYSLVHKRIFDRNWEPKKALTEKARRQYYHACKKNS